jgi:hypothetical protein
MLTTPCFILGWGEGNKENQGKAKEQTRTNRRKTKEQPRKSLGGKKEKLGNQEKPRTVKETEQNNHGFEERWKVMVLVLVWF